MHPVSMPFFCRIKGAASQKNDTKITWLAQNLPGPKGPAHPVVLIVAADPRCSFVAISGAMAPYIRRLQWPSADTLSPTSAKA
jgi:hypothetical protein